MKSINLGLSSKELDLVVSYFLKSEKQNDEEVDWKNFVNKFEAKSVEKALLNRFILKLNELKNDLYNHLISPKDAFREYDKTKLGHLNLYQF
jgi:hypothetical protein